MQGLSVSDAKDGLRVVVYPGDNKILIAMSLEDSAIGPASNLAGFAIWRKHEGQDEEVLFNRITFTSGVDNTTTAETRKWTPSDQAPFQKFRWADVPKDGFDVPITYRVRAKMFAAANGSAMKDGPEVTVRVTPVRASHKRFKAAFTRGYIASQAYADRFQNKDIRPAGEKSLTFDTKPFAPQYEWLGADARVLMQKFIDDCRNDKSAKVDVFAYDLDEPDVVAAICAFGREGRLRAILDDAALHSKADKKTGKFPIEVEAAKMIIQAAGEGNVRQGHFNRFQHNKVFIKRDKDRNAQSVFFGSMNFSVRGLYVQANNVIVVDDPKVAGMFADAFDAAFEGDVTLASIRDNKISADAMVGSPSNTADLPKFTLALSPHKNAQISLGPMTNRIRSAASSVLFAVMAPTGGGQVLTSLRSIAARPTVFSYGTVETDSGLAVQNPDGAMGDIVGFAALDKNVPWPFNKEFSGGRGMHIHDKFVIVDFNGENPTVFTGSSNLADGGETANGDSLAMIEDASIANMYAIEALALFDHYHFRKAMKNATKAEPLTLWFPGKYPDTDPRSKPWWQRSYDQHLIQFRDRCLFAQVPLPEGLQAVKNVDWKSIDEEAAKAKKKKGGGEAAKTAKSKPESKPKSKSKSAKTAKKSASKKSKKKSKAKAKKAKTKKAKAKTAKAKKAKKTKKAKRR
jgi:phosphatidylserine/phosphatidylglycerophosphate/cardiolipin synthase-like enzyme